ncbi:MAG: radical SAM family heme chaperone HemW [Pseudomonadota bacterium]
MHATATKAEPGLAVRNPDPAGFGVYVHWPFCAAKCPYCDFNSHVRHGGIDEAAFRSAFLTDIGAQARATDARNVTSIFFGGGTPSLMSAETVGAILGAIDTQWGISPGAEITLEANPTSVEAQRFRDYRAAGVNRVSLGVQALDDASLRALGRLHTVDEAIAAIGIARAEFDRMSFDLIYARPRQTLEAWERELRQAIDLAADHLSLYQLTIEPGTPFETLHASGKLIIPNPDLADDLYALTDQVTRDAGLPLYEISNHARPGDESRHNLLYWRYGEYVGIGPGAHGRPILDGTRTATETERQPEAWASRVGHHGDGITAREPLIKSEIADEALLMGLRLAEGLSLARFAWLAGVQPDPVTIADLTADGFLTMPDAGHLAATPKGRFVLNRLVLSLSETLSPAA